METAANNPEVFGLVLAGGRSRRMGQDKAALLVGGQPQLRRTFDCLSAVCARAWVSCRREQAELPIYREFPTLPDTWGETGPMGGILSAMARYPQSAWLVVACDLPLLTPELLSRLLGHRHGERDAVVYQRSDQPSPEPLCSVYEPGCRAVLENFHRQGNYALISALSRMRVCRIVPADGRFLLNVNSPEALAGPGLEAQAPLCDNTP